MEEDLGEHRKSLFKVLIENLKNDMISTVYADSYFTEQHTLKDLEASLIMTRITDAGIDHMNKYGVGEDQIPEEYVIKREVTAADINS